MMKALASRIGLGLFATVATIFFLGVVLTLLVWDRWNWLCFHLKHGWKAARPKSKWL